MIDALRTKEQQNWQKVSARMIQEYEYLRGTSGSRNNHGSREKGEQALPAVEAKKKKNMKYIFCKKPGHLKRDC